MEIIPPLAWLFQSKKKQVGNGVFVMERLAHYVQKKQTVIDGTIGVINIELPTMGTLFTATVLPQPNNMARSFARLTYVITGAGAYYTFLLNYGTILKITNATIPLSWDGAIPLIDTIPNFLEAKVWNNTGSSKDVVLSGVVRSG